MWRIGKMLESFLPYYVQNVLMGLIAVVLVLSLLARRMPHVVWLQFFSLPDYRTEEQKMRAHRSGDMVAGLEMILAGIAVPVVYLVGTIMFFSEPSQGALLAVGALSVLLVTMGFRAIAKAARPDR